MVIVDDYELVRSALEAAMGEHDDLEVVGLAASIEEALAVSVATRPDVVLMDYRLPDGDGAMATRAVRQAVPSVRVVMLTGRDDAETRALALEAGCSGYVVKGAKLDQVMATVRAAAASDAPASDPPADIQP